MEKITKAIVDLLYRTKSKKRQFEAQNSEHVLIADASKAIITNSNSDVKRGANWVASQRAVIFLTDTKIVCGEWIIPIDEISNASLFKFKAFLSSGGQVLKIETLDGDNYQFGMQNNDEWETQTVFDIIIENGKLKTSPFSLILRLFIFAYLIYFLLQNFGIL